MVDLTLVQGAHAQDSGSNYIIYIIDSFQNAFATIAFFVAITKLDCFVFTGRGTRGNSCTAKSAGSQKYIYFNRRVTTRIKNFSSYYFYNFHTFTI